MLLHVLMRPILESRNVVTQDKKTASAVKKKPLSWDDLLTLATLAREGSWGGAAKALGLTRNTVIRRIQRLELALDAQVVEEGQDGIVLTPRGRDAVAAAEEMGQLAENVVQASGQIAASAIHGLVRVTASEGISAHLIAPALGGLLREYPALRVDLIASSAVLSISHKQADVAVRLTPPEDEQLIALPVGVLTYSLYRAAMPEGAGGTGATDSAALVAYDTSASRYPEVQALQRMFHDRQPRVRSNSLQVQLEAVRSGAGSTLLPDYLAQRYLSQGLQKLSDVVLEKPVFVVFHSKHRDTPRVRVVTAWLQQLMLRSLALEN
jgi:DNA-binding transcriptional LysR family regulator